MWAGVRESLPLVGSRAAGLPGKGLALPWAWAGGAPCSPQEKGCGAACLGEEGLRVSTDSVGLLPLLPPWGSGGSRRGQGPAQAPRGQMEPPCGQNGCVGAPAVTVTPPRAPGLGAALSTELLVGVSNEENGGAVWGGSPRVFRVRIHGSAGQGSGSPLVHLNPRGGASPETRFVDTALVPSALPSQSEFSGCRTFTVLP